MTVTPITDIPGMVSSLRETYTRGVTRPLEWRAKQLQALRKLLEENKDEIIEALHKDLGRPKQDAELEQLDTLSQVHYMQKNLASLAKTEKLPTRLILKPLSFEVWKEPLGVVTIIAPFNMPFTVLLAPLAGAIAAGNACVLKPSELTAACEELISKLIAKYMDSSAIRVVTGGVPETTALLAQKVDHILYTGGSAVGRIVMAAAAKNLTLVTLELGGMCPAYVDQSANIETSARRLLQAKCNNAGQLCIAPNHVLVHEKVRDEFLKALKTEHDRLYPGEDLLKNPDLGRIVNDRHYARIMRLLENHGGEVVMGAETVESERFIPLTVVTNPSMDSNLMKEEILGPILPVITVKSVEEAITIAREGNTPLASYVFDRDSKVRNKWLATVEAGGACVNDCIYHIMNDEMSGLGGKGESGMRRVRGKSSFNTFTHSKVVAIQSANFDPPGRYPPYTGVTAFMKMVIVNEIPSWVKLAFWGAAGAVGLAVAAFVKKHVSVSVSFQ